MKGDIICPSDSNPATASRNWCPQRESVPETGWWVPNNAAAIPIQVLSESLMARMKNHQIEWNEAVQPEPVLELGPPLSIR